MSTLPPPGWQPQRPGQSPHNLPPHGWQPGGFPPSGPTGGNSQEKWNQQPQPPKGGDTTKLLLLAIAVLLVIGVTIGATLLLSGRTGGANPSSAQNQSDFASADDVDPVSIITDDPTCVTFVPINDSLVDLRLQGWGDERAKLGPSQSWTERQKSLVASIANATSKAADTVVRLSEQTPHRAMRELYEQFIAYGRAYVESIPSYQPVDNYLASVNVNVGDALISICSAITTGSFSRGITVKDARRPSNPSLPASDPNNPSMFLAAPIEGCDAWIQREMRLSPDLTAWSQLNTSIPGSQWTSEERDTQAAAIPALNRLGSQTSDAAYASSNSVVEDFGALADLYLQAYASVGTSYIEADSWLSGSALRLINTVTDACRAVEK